MNQRSLGAGVDSQPLNHTSQATLEFFTIIVEKAILRKKEKVDWFKGVAWEGGGQGQVWECAPSECFGGAMLNTA